MPIPKKSPWMVVVLVLLTGCLTSRALRGTEEERLAEIARLGAECDPRGVRKLALYLEAPEPRVRGTAVEALASCGDRRSALDVLPLLTDRSAEVRAAAAAALGVLRNTQAIPALAERLGDPDP